MIYGEGKMEHKRLNALVCLFFLASLYCHATKVAGKKGKSIIYQRDEANWRLLAKHTKNSTQKTTDPGSPNVFTKILLANMKARSKVGRNDDGVFLYQGDIKLSNADAMKLLGIGKGRGKRALMKNKTLLWKSPIHYQLSPSLNKAAVIAIGKAIKDWKSVLTCVQWKEVIKAPKGRGYLYFFAGDGCYSNLGRSGEIKQTISIGKGCEDRGTVVHEIAHALGIGHEQARPDRDNFVKIILKNVIPAMKFNFKKFTNSKVDSLGKPYDYASVMHYGESNYAMRDGLKTIVSLEERKKFGGNRLSTLDKEQAKLLYCKGKGTPSPLPTTTPPLPSTASPGSGFVIGSASGAGSGGGPSG